MTRSFTLLLCTALFWGLSLGTAQSTPGTQGSEQAADSSSDALEAQRAQLRARETVLAEADAALEPQRIEVARRRSVVDEQLAALAAQEDALNAQEDALAAQEDPSEAQQNALALQREALTRQQAALQAQVQEVEALEAELAAQEEQLAAQRAGLEGRRAVLRRAEQAAQLRQQVAEQARQTLLESLLVTLEENPRYRAAEAAVDAAEAQLRAAYNPVTLGIEGSYTRFGLDDEVVPSQGFSEPIPLQNPAQPPGQSPGQGDIPESQTELSANATFRPFPFGDVRDLVQQQELALENATLDFREAVTGLQGQALEAALQFRLAQQSVDLAERTVEAARLGLDATRMRFERGGANERDLRDAEANFQESQNFAQNAQANLELARLSLGTLNLGEFADALSRASAEEIDALLALPRVQEGLPLSVRRSQVSLAQAAIGVGSARRDLIPTANVSYSYNLDDNSALTASLESRTLQPSIGYSYQDPERGLPESAVESAFRIGVSAEISFGTFAEIDAAADQRRAAEAGVEAAEDGAEIEGVRLTNVLNEAERTLALEQIQFRNAQRAFEENQQRQELGLITPLETQQALVELLQADIELRQTRFSTLQALLDLYEFYALPPSEVLL